MIVIRIGLNEVLEVFDVDDLTVLFVVWSVDDVAVEILHIIAHMILGIQLI